MRHLELTLPGIAENIALDEALLEEAEAASRPMETLRLWEADRMAVVIGRSSHLAIEVQREFCRRKNIPVLRRISGGAAVVVGPGCLMYSLVLNLEQRPDLRSIDLAHRQVLGRIATALRPFVPGIELRGICDLTLGELKVSGNSVRIKRRHILYHGTLLYDFPLAAIGRCLAMPPRQPEYRRAREHDAFVANLPIAAEALRTALRLAWPADEPCGEWPQAATEQWVAQRYSQSTWNEQL